MFLFQKPQVVHLTKIKFFNLSSVLADVGGILSLVSTIPILFLVCLNKSFFRSLSLDIMKKKAAVESIEEQIVRERFTYESIYELYDRVQSIEQRGVHKTGQRQGSLSQKEILAELQALASKHEDLHSDHEQLKAEF